MLTIPPPLTRTLTQNTNPSLDPRNTNLDGYNKCKSAIISQQITSRTYVRKDVVTNMRDLASRWGSNPLCITSVDSSIPEWMYLPGVPESLIIDNAMHNAKTHGKRGEKYELNLRMNGDRFSIEIKNKGGENHEEVLRMQQEQGINFILLDGNTKFDTIGSQQSTFLGMGEMMDAAVIVA